MNASMFSLLLSNPGRLSSGPRSNTTRYNTQTRMPKDKVAIIAKNGTWKPFAEKKNGELSKPAGKFLDANGGPVSKGVKIKPVSKGNLGYG